MLSLRSLMVPDSVCGSPSSDSKEKSAPKGADFCHKLSDSAKSAVKAAGGEYNGDEGFD